MKQYVKTIEGYSEIEKEIEICRKYGNNYSTEKGKTGRITDLYHPSYLNLRVSELIEETENAKTLRLVSETGYLPPFQAGQYINIFVEIDGVRTSRPYSISSSPGERLYYDITICRIENGFVSDYLLDTVKPGDSLKSSGPAGNFYHNPAFHGNDLVFLAGGSGITPFMSMIREFCYKYPERNITLLYGNRTENNVIFIKELERFAKNHSNFTFHLVVSDPSSSYNGICGLIDSITIKENVKNYDTATFYLCGPGAMYDFCLSELDCIKIPFKRIRKEMFSSAGDVTTEPGWPSEMTGKEKFKVKVRGMKDVEACANESLLTSLERAGIEIPVCCRSGECSLCRVKLVSGNVFQPRGVLLREADEKYGYIHSCKSYPMSDLEIIL